MLFQTSVSSVILFNAFDETGHRNGYEEGHLDTEDQQAGCSAAYMWLLLQACCDLAITLMTCILVLIRLKSDPVSFHGCIATLRLCTLSAGFHILYFSGLKRELCDQPLIVEILPYMVYNRDMPWHHLHGLDVLLPFQLVIEWKESKTAGV
jgi:hypothetical protein